MSTRLAPGLGLQLKQATKSLQPSLGARMYTFACTFPSSDQSRNIQADGCDYVDEP